MAIESLSLLDAIAQRIEAAKLAAQQKQRLAAEAAKSKPGVRVFPEDQLPVKGFKSERTGGR